MSLARPQLTILSEDQRRQIYLSMLEVLERTGVEVAEEEALQVLRQGGATVHGTRASIPPHMVKAALASAPPRFTVHARDAGKSLRIEPGRVYYGPGPTCPYFIDVSTGQRRRYVRHDAATTARVCDALDNIDFVMSLGAISDVRQSMSDVYEFAEMAANTVKPIVAWSFTLESCEEIHRMAVAVAGGEEEFSRRPNYIFYAEPLSPLASNKEAAQKLVYCSRHRIPLVYTPCPIAGATAPATLAGVLVNALAESIHGLVISQLLQPGTPFVAGGVVSIMDMAETVLSYGAPELSLLSAALSEMCHFLGLPMWSTAGCTDSKLMDEQAAAESALSVAMAGLSGADLVHDVGFIESAMTGSLDMLVVSDEIIAMARRILRGFEVDDATLATEVISEVGPAGQFLDHPHTAERFRREFWFPRLMDRSRYDSWNAGGRHTLLQRARQRLSRILAEHHAPQLPARAAEAIGSILTEREKKEAKAAP